MKANLKGDAIAAYEAACRRPKQADWRAVAELLRAALPRERAKARDRDDGFTDIVEYETGKSTRVGPTIVVTFDDGTLIRATSWTADGKPINGGRALRVACSFYRTTVGASHLRGIPMGARGDLDAINTIAVPAIRSAHCERDGETVAAFDPAECSAFTAAIRGGVALPKWIARHEALRARSAHRRKAA
jgi:hypothetical protein